jgi:hypothetical protein
MAGQVWKLAWMHLNRKAGSMTNRVDRGQHVSFHFTGCTTKDALTPDTCPEVLQIPEESHGWTPAVKVSENSLPEHLRPESLVNCLVCPL